MSACPICAWIQDALRPACADRVTKVRRSVCGVIAGGRTESPRAARLRAGRQHATVEVLSRMRRPALRRKHQLVSARELGFLEVEQQLLAQERRHVDLADARVGLAVLDHYAAVGEVEVTTTQARHLM